MTAYRSRRTCEAVQWFPGADVPGVTIASDDLAYQMGWPSGSAYLRTTAGVLIVRPGDWVTWPPDGGRQVVGDEWFGKEWEASTG